MTPQAQWASLNGDNVYQYMFTFKGLYFLLYGFCYRQFP
jgi:hypothetical protein